MIKNILHPGNGIDFPKKGDYVKFNLFIQDENKNIFYNDFEEIRIGFNSNFIKCIEDLIREMSIFEKCSLEIENNKNNKEVINNLESEMIKELLIKSIYKKIIFEVEIVNINKTSHY